MKQRKHVWIDGSLRDGEWYQRYFEQLRSKYPEYQIAVINVTASKDVIFERVKRRADETGRDVPTAEVLDSIERVPKTVAQLAGMLEFLAIIDNSAEDGVPRLKKYCDVDMCYLNADWDQIQRRFKSKSRKLSSSSSTLVRAEISNSTWRAEVSTQVEPNGIHLVGTAEHVDDRGEAAAKLGGAHLDGEVKLVHSRLKQFRPFSWGSTLKRWWQEKARATRRNGA